MLPNQAVKLAYQHSANLDGLLLVLLTRSIGLGGHWMVKDVWVKPPIGWLTRRVGVVPVNRGQASGMVGQMVECFETEDEYVPLIPPIDLTGVSEIDVNTTRAIDPDAVRWRAIRRRSARSDSRTSPWSSQTESFDGHQASERTPTRSYWSPSTTPSLRRSPSVSEMPGRPCAHR